MKKESIELKIEGMTCTNCARTVTKFLERKGMEEVFVNVTTHEARFVNNTDVSLDVIKKGIDKLGFSVIDDEEDTRNSSFWTLERKLTLSIFFTAPLFFGHILMMFGLNLPFLEYHWVQFVLAFPVYIVGVSHFGKSAWNALRMGHTNMDVLIFIGSTAAFIYSLVGWVMNDPKLIFFETAASIITLVLLGNIMEKRAVNKTTQAISDLHGLQTKEAQRLMLDGSVQKITTCSILKGYRLQINEGDAIPCDGEVISGTGLVDESMLTGESEWVSKEQGATLTGAAILVSGNLVMKATAVGQDTVLSKIINLVKNTQAETPDVQRLADKISSIFVPVVLGLSVLTIATHVFLGTPFSKALMNGIAVLVVSCPCAMGLATPAAIMVGVGRAAKQGILIRGSRTLEVFAHVKHILLDKTGTITEGKFGIQNFEILQGDVKEIQAATKALELHSSHPIAQSLVHEIKEEPAKNFTEVQEEKGVKIQGKDALGNLWELGSYRIAQHLTEDDRHNVYVLKNKELVAQISLADALKKGAKDVVKYFNQHELETTLLSGDKQEKVLETALATGITHYKAEQLPQQKYDFIHDKKQTGLTAMVGDGINDAAALAKADVGITFGSASDVAVQSAGIVLLNDAVESIALAHKISRHTLLTIRQNLFWAFAYNLVAIPIAMMGLLNPMWGALFMAFSDVVVIGNSLRLRTKKLK